MVMLSYTEWVLFSLSLETKELHILWISFRGTAVILLLLTRRGLLSDSF